MSNKFDREKLQRYYIDNHECWFCGGNQPDCIHHCIPRSDTANCSNSILNTAPLCNYPCHLNNHGLLTTDEWKAKLLQKTIRYLLAQKYELTEEDKTFIIQNLKYYK